MSATLVLSLFPGIGLLDMGFEEEGFCVVRGPDLLWGGDVRRFHPPAHVFDGVIGGPPCQRFSRLANLVRHVYGEEKLAPNLIPEFERVVSEAAPTWFLMENVPEAPAAQVQGYVVHDRMVRDVWVGGATTRLRRFCFGTHDGAALRVEELALHRTDPLPAVLASGGRWIPVGIGGSGKPKRKKVRRANGRESEGYIYGAKTSRYFTEAVEAQGLPATFDLPGLTVAAKIKAIGNGVPVPMARAVAKAVRRAFSDDPVETST
jgi:DNA (cytosine-5)-methyltransferase 1